MKEKDLSIETLRGVAIILMVMAHVIGTNSRLGLQVADESFLRWLYCLTENFRMPLFTVISGYIYAVRPLSKNQSKKFLKGKINRLFYPLIFVSTLQFLVRYFTPGTNTKVDLSKIWRIYIYSYDQFWFLQAIILVFIFLVFLEYFELLKTFKSWLISFIILYFISVFFPFRTGVFSFNNFLYLITPFVLGIGLYRYKGILINKKTLIISLLLFLISLLVQQLSYFNKIDIVLGRTSALGILFGLIGNIFFFNIKSINIKLAWLGTYAFDIYLFHVFGQAGSRILMKLLGFQNIALYFLINLSCGLFIPILLSTMFKNNYYTKKFLLGLK